MPRVPPSTLSSSVAPTAAAGGRTAQIRMPGAPSTNGKRRLSSAANRPRKTKKSTSGASAVPSAKPTRRRASSLARSPRKLKVARDASTGRRPKAAVGSGPGDGRVIRRPSQQHLAYAKFKYGSYLQWFFGENPETKIDLIINDNIDTKFMIEWNDVPLPEWQMNFLVKKVTSRKSGIQTFAVLPEYIAFVKKGPTMGIEFPPKSPVPPVPPAPTLATSAKSDSSAPAPIPIPPAFAKGRDTKSPGSATMSTDQPDLSDVNTITKVWMLKPWVYSTQGKLHSGFMQTETWNGSFTDTCAASLYVPTEERETYYSHWRWSGVVRRKVIGLSAENPIQFSGFTRVNGNPNRGVPDSIFVYGDHGAADLIPVNSDSLFSVQTWVRSLRKLQAMNGLRRFTWEYDGALWSSSELKKKLGSFDPYGTILAAEYFEGGIHLTIKCSDFPHTSDIYMLVIDPYSKTIQRFGRLHVAPHIVQAEFLKSVTGLWTWVAAGKDHKVHNMFVLFGETWQKANPLSDIHLGQKIYIGDTDGSIKRVWVSREGKVQELVVRCDGKDTSDGSIKSSEFVAVRPLDPVTPADAEVV